MYFVGIALVVAAILVLLISADAGALIGLEQSEFGNLVVLVALLVLVAGGISGTRVRFGAMVSGTILWVGIFGLAIMGYGFRVEIEQFGARFLSELSPGRAYVSKDRSTVRFVRSMSGSFIIHGAVNSVATQFIFDTGATSVVLTAEDARNAGIDIERLSYTVPVRTANGETTSAFTYIARLETGGIVRNNIAALVAQPGTLETSLLGMTFLETLKSYTVARDALEFQD